LAIVAFTLAALTRESSLLVPLVLLAIEIPRIRLRESGRAIVLGSALWDRRAFVTLHRARSPARRAP